MWLWMIQNILGKIPMLLWPMIAAAAAAAIVFAKVIKSLPQFKLITYLVKPVAIASFVAALFLWGGAGVNAIYMDQIKEMQDKVAAAEAAAAEANQKLSDKLAEKSKVIRDVQVVFKDKVRTITQKIDSECKVDRSAIEALNTLARGDSSK